jgi:hypothetical protein
MKYNSIFIYYSASKRTHVCDDSTLLTLIEPESLTTTGCPFKESWILNTVPISGVDPSIFTNHKKFPSAAADVEVL